MEEAVVYFVGRLSEDVKEEIRRVAAERGLRIVAYFVDPPHAKSVPLWRRRNYLAAVDFALAHRIRNIIFYSLCFGRNACETAYELKRLMDEGLKFYFVKPLT